MTSFKRNLLLKELDNQFLKPPQGIETSVKKLWTLFNKSRSLSDELPSYMDDPQLLQAYCAAFLLPNIDRMRSVLHSKSVAKALKDLTQSLKNPSSLKVLDYGAGPLSASFALLDVLSASQFPLERLCLHAIDGSQSAVQWGCDLMVKTLDTDTKYPQVAAGRHYKDTREKYHLILLSNVINEIKVKSRLQLLDHFSKSLEPGGLLIILEPGQDRHSWALSDLRNRFLQSHPEGFALLAPCPHTLTCPLSPGLGRKDWCWFRTPMARPRWLTQLDKVTGLDHRELTYSFLVLQKKQQHIRSGAHGVLSHRVVSDPIPVKDQRALKYALHANQAKHSRLVQKEFISGNLCKSLLCTGQGQLVGTYFSNRNVPPWAHRGHAMVGQAGDEVLLMAPERVETGAVGQKELSETPLPPRNRNRQSSRGAGRGHNPKGTAPRSKGS